VQAAPAKQVKQVAIPALERYGRAKTLIRSGEILSICCVSEVEFFEKQINWHLVDFKCFKQI